MTTTGPFNQHFVRDIGLVFLFVGTAYLAGAFLPRHRVVLWAAPTLWLWGHALFTSGKSPSASAVRLRSRGISPPSLSRLSSARSSTLWSLRDARAAESARASCSEHSSTSHRLCPAEGEVQMKPRMNIFKAAPEGTKGLMAVEVIIDKSGLEHSLLELSEAAAHLR